MWPLLHKPHSQCDKHIMDERPITRDGKQAAPDAEHRMSTAQLEVSPSRSAAQNFKQIDAWPVGPI